MKRVLIAGAVALLFSACTQEKKMESVCVDFLKLNDSDPGALKINSIKHTSGGLHERDIDSYFNMKYPDGLFESAKRLKEIRIEEKSTSSQMFVEVDYTTKNISGGPVRDTALCRFIQWGDKSRELISFTVHNVDIDQHKFSSIFRIKEKPTGLDDYFKLK